jgi:hypothetical protein
MFTCKFAQDELTHQRLRVGSKKSVQQGREWLSVSRRGPPLFDARSVCGIGEHGKMARTPLAAFFNRPQKTVVRNSHLITAATVPWSLRGPAGQDKFSDHAA